MMLFFEYYVLFVAVICTKNCNLDEKVVFGMLLRILIFDDFAKPIAHTW